MEAKQENDYQNRIFGDYAEILYRLCHECDYCPCTAGCTGWLKAGTEKNSYMICMNWGSASDRPYRKCARIVGDTMGKYHPHGDSSIYEALGCDGTGFQERTCLWWTDMEILVPSREMVLQQCVIRKHAWQKLTAGSLSWQTLTKMLWILCRTLMRRRKSRWSFRSRIPNLLVNGAEGIAVGMATSIPPHNLGEVVDAVKAYMKDNTISYQAV